MQHVGIPHVCQFFGGNIAHWPEEYPWNFGVYYIEEQSAIDDKLTLPSRIILYQNLKIHFRILEGKLQNNKVFKNAYS